MLAHDPHGAGDLLAAFAKALLWTARGNSGVILSQLARGLAEACAGRRRRRRIAARPTGSCAPSSAAARRSPTPRRARSSPWPAPWRTAATERPPRVGGRRRDEPVCRVAGGARGRPGGARAHSRAARGARPRRGRRRRGCRPRHAARVPRTHLLRAARPPQRATTRRAGAARFRPERLGPDALARPAPTPTPTRSLDRGDVLARLRGDVPARRLRRGGGRPAAGRLVELGDSVLVVGGDGEWNIHAHVDDAGAAVEAGIVAGRPHRVRITRLDRDQSWPRRPMRARRSVTPAHGPAARHTGSAIVACAAGDGLAALFGEAGAAVVPSGPGRRASTGALIDAIRAQHATGAGGRRRAAQRRRHPAGRGGGGPGGRRRRHRRAGRARPHGGAGPRRPRRLRARGRRRSANVLAMQSASSATRHGAVTVANRAALTSAGPVRAGRRARRRRRRHRRHRPRRRRGGARGRCAGSSRAGASSSPSSSAPTPVTGWGRPSRPRRWRCSAGSRCRRSTAGSRSTACSIGVE